MFRGKIWNMIVKLMRNLQKIFDAIQIVKAITNFAKSMDIKVIAEYVENEEIQEKVTELEIEFSQGYLFSEPKSTM